MSSKAKKTIFLLFLLSIALTTFTAFILPSIVKSVIKSRLSTVLNRTVSVSDIVINPLELSISLRGVSLSEPQKKEVFFKFDELYLNFESISLFKKAFVTQRILLKNPFIRIHRNADKTYNFSDLLNLSLNNKSRTSKTINFSLNNIEIANGKIIFIDSPKAKTHTIDNLTLRIPFFSNIANDTGIFVKPQLQGILNGSLFQFHGQTKPFAQSLETSLNIKLKSIDIPYYLDYLPFALPVKLDRAKFDSDVTVKYTQFTNKPPLIDIQGDVSLNSVDIKFHDKSPWIYFENLYVRIFSTDIINREFNIDTVQLIKPIVNKQRGKDGSIKLPQLHVADNAGNETKKQDDTSKIRLSINKASIKNGVVNFVDLSNTAPFKTTIKSVDLDIDNISTTNKATAKTILSFETGFKERFALNADIALDPIIVKGSVKTQNIALKNYLPFYQDKILFNIDDGVIGANIAFKADQQKDDFKIVLSDIGLDLRSLVLRKQDRQSPFVNIPALKVSNASLDMHSKQIDLGSITTKDGVINIERYDNGTLNITNLTPHRGDNALVQNDNATKTTSNKNIKNIQKPQRDWQFKMVKSDIEKYAITYVDYTLQEPFKASINDIHLVVQNLSNTKNTQAKVSLSSKFNDNASISLVGMVGILPLTSSLKVDINALGLDNFQPLVQRFLNITLYNGYLSARGNTTFSQTDNKSINVTFRGETSIANLDIEDDNAEELLKWKSLYIGIIDVKYAPLNISIDEIALSDFYSKVVINKDATLNLQRIVKKDNSTIEQKDNLTATKSQQDNTPDNTTTERFIKIGKITLQGGTINFTDNHITPPYSANLLEIGGRVSGMTSLDNSSADVELRGKLENYAPLEITGKINPLLKDLFVDLKIDFKNIELSPLSPYSGKYVGYTIEKGKLSLGVKYLIADRKLDASNNIFLDQFAFGDAVQSPDATRLPVRLAVALLKNRKGEIDIDIPVSGSLDDPKFSLGSVIWKAILNILLKVATAPFALLGALFGSSDESSWLEFDYGSDVITPEGANKLDNIAKALIDRPAIRLELQGYIDPDKDKEGLRNELFKRKLRLAKAKDLKVSIDNVTLNPEEYSKYLKLAYRDEKFPKPRNVLGFIKDLPDDEMEKLMLTHTIVTEVELRRLASDRAKRIKDYFVTHGKIDPARIFLTESSSAEASKHDKAKKSRVDFKLTTQ